MRGNPHDVGGSQVYFANVGLLTRADGELEVVHLAAVGGGLRYPGDILVHLLAHRASP